MNRSHCLARTVALLVLLSHVAACQLGPEPEPLSPSPAQRTDTTGQPTSPPPVQSSPYSLTAPVQAPATGTAPPPGSGNRIRGVLTRLSFGNPDFRYDAYVVTARQSGPVSIRSNVLEAQVYPYGYAYPIELLTIEDGFKLVAWASVNYQNALETGTAVLEQRVEAGHQYLLVYKTFTAFTPLTYRLTLPSTLTVEGRIYLPPEPMSVSPNSTSLITLENPRPDALELFITELDAQILLR